MIDDSTSSSFIKGVDVAARGAARAGAPMALPSLASSGAPPAPFARCTANRRSASRCATPSALSAFLALSAARAAFFSSVSNRRARRLRLSNERYVST